MLTVLYFLAFQLLWVDYFQLYKYQLAHDSCLNVYHHERHDENSPIGVKGINIKLLSHQTEMI